jgi:hypothetical protein
MNHLGFLTCFVAGFAVDVAGLAGAFVSCFAFFAPFFGFLSPILVTPPTLRLSLYSFSYDIYSLSLENIIIFLLGK